MMIVLAIVIGLNDAGSSYKFSNLRRSQGSEGTPASITYPYRDFSIKPMEPASSGGNTEE
jgi:hypothetical protein